MSKHTPEPWTTHSMPPEIECRKRGDWIMLHSDDWFRARDSVNALAGIENPQEFREAVEALIVEVVEWEQWDAPPPLLRNYLERIAKAKGTP